MSNAEFSSYPPKDSDATQVVSRSATTAVLAPGTLLGNNYIIEEMLARGGMGEVYRARHIELETEYAIKTILPSLADDPRIVQLFREEARKLERLNHDAIVNYKGFFRDERGLRYLVTEFVHGESLEQVLRRRRLEPEEVLRLRDRLALGLAVAHEMGIVHRDVSPENILLPSGSIERAKLIDFGIAKSTDPSGVTFIGSDFAGKYSFVSPEQVGLFGGRVDLRSDIYSLGLVLAAAAIGFGGRLDMGNTVPTMISARQRIPDLSEVPASLRPVIAPMLEPRPDKRPPSMRALIGDGAARANTEGRSSRRVSGAPARYYIWAAAGLAAVLLAAVAAALIMLRQAIPPPSKEQLQTELAAAAGGYRCASLQYSVAPDRTAQISGFAASPEDIEHLRSAVGKIVGINKVVFDVGLRIWPFCEAAGLLEPVIKHTPAPPPSLQLAADPHVGGSLVIDLRAPSFDGYTYIDYFADADGTVIHLLPNSEDINFEPRRNHRILGNEKGKRCWILGGSGGEQQLLTLVASAKPLWRTQGREQDNARDYLPVLADAIKNTGGTQNAAALLFFKLLDPSPLRSGRSGCQ
jgi:Protein kinase domain